jgi:hypothetical protein
MAAPENGLSVVTDAYLMAGVIGQGQNLNAFDINLGLRRLNGMLGLWNTRRWMVWHLVELGKTSDGRTTPYTVGPASDYPVARRPDRVEFAFVRQLSQNQGLPVDTPLRVWQAREQYDLATLKLNFVSYPSGVFLDTSWPQGKLFIYPWPTASLYQIFIAMKDVFPVFAANTLMDQIPDQYLECMKTNLARVIRQNYGKGVRPDPELNEQAKSALNTVKNSNLQVPELNMPIGLPGAGNKIYNIYSDNNS